MSHIFNVKDKTGRNIRLTEKQWKHIIRKHPQVSNYKEEMINTLVNPLKISDYSLDENVRYYYYYLKQKISPEKYLVVIVKHQKPNVFVA